MASHVLECAHPRAAQLATHSVLIVDDDKALVAALASRLKEHGFNSITAESGEEALSIARRDRPDLIVLDLRLPDMNGLEVCSQLVDDRTTCGIPVIILSGMARPDIIRQSRAAGCSYYVRKPYDPNALLLLIQQSIQESRGWN